MNSPREPLAWVDGDIRPWAGVTVHASALGTAHASACFEGIRGYWNEQLGVLNVFKLDEHIRRLTQSMKVLRLRTEYDAAALSAAVVELLGRAGWREDVYLRVLAFEASDVAGQFTMDARATILITALPRPSKLLTGSAKRCAISSWRRISDEALPPRVKAVANYLNSRYACLQAMADGYDDAILLDHAGHVAEGSAACFFMVRDGVLITAPVSGEILESVTRGTLMQLAAEQFGVDTVQRAIDRTELYVADEAFLCGTGGGEVTPVTSVDRYPVGTGEVGELTGRIRNAYNDVVRGATPYGRQWLTTVPSALAMNEAHS